MQRCATASCLHKVLLESAICQQAGDDGGGSGGQRRPLWVCRATCNMAQYCTADAAVLARCFGCVGISQREGCATYMPDRTHGTSSYNIHTPVASGRTCATCSVARSLARGWNGAVGVAALQPRVRAGRGERLVTRPEPQAPNRMAMGERIPGVPKTRAWPAIVCALGRALVRAPRLDAVLPARRMAGG